MTDADEFATALMARAMEGQYILPGENRHYGKVSSGLYREYPDLAPGVEYFQQQELDEARKYTGETDDLAILTEIQHYGGKTNLIDFTTDPLIALFFACYGQTQEDGRVILVSKTDKYAGYICYPSDSNNRVLDQRSIFLRPLAGFIQPEEGDVISVPAALKGRLLAYLRQEYGISSESVYRDIPGFIRAQAIRRQEAGKNGDIIESFSARIELQPYSASLYMRRGDAHFKNEDSVNAINDYSQALNIAPSDATILYKRADAHLALGDPASAVADYDSIEAAAKSRDSINCIRRARALYSMKEYQRAFDDYTTALELGETRFEERVHLSRALTYQALGDDENADADFQRAFQIEPALRNAPLTILKVESFIAFSKERNIGQTIFAHPEDTTDDAWYHRRLAEVYVEEQRYDLALQHLDHAIQLDASNESALVNRGVANAGTEQYDLAIKDFTTAININPSNSYAYHCRGTTHFHMREYEGSIEDQTLAIRLASAVDPVDNYYRARGAAYLHGERYHLALTDYTAIGANSEIAKTHFRRGCS